MTEPLTVEQRAKGAAGDVLDTLLCATDPVMLSPDDAETLIVQAFITAITEAEAIGEARGMDRGAEIANKAWEEVLETIRKEAAESAKGDRG